MKPEDTRYDEIMREPATAPDREQAERGEYDDLAKAAAEGWHLTEREVIALGAAYLVQEREINRMRGALEWIAKNVREPRMQLEAEGALESGDKQRADSEEHGYTFSTAPDHEQAERQIREHRLERASREWLVDRIETLEAQLVEAQAHSREASEMYLAADKQIGELLSQQSFMERKLAAKEQQLQAAIEQDYCTICGKALASAHSGEVP